MSDGTMLLNLPKHGCLRIITKNPCEWHEFELADVYVVVLPDHPVISPVKQGQAGKPPETA